MRGQCSPAADTSDPAPLAVLWDDDGIDASGALMTALETVRYPTCETPTDIDCDAVTLRPWQCQTLQRAADHESLPGGLNSLFWERKGDGSWRHAACF